MLIDWFTVFAQIVNFLILVLLLWRFLYGPILSAMQERKQKISADREEAVRMRREAEARAGELEAERRSFESEREGMMREAEDEAAKLKEERLGEARREVEEKRDMWLAALEKEQSDTARSFRVHAVASLKSAARRALEDLAGADLEERAVAVFLERLAADAEGRADVADLGQDVLVRTGFPLSETSRAMVLERLAALLPGRGTPQFLVHPDLGFGIELVAGGRKWDWNLSRWLDELEHEILKALPGVSPALEG